MVTLKYNKQIKFKGGSHLKNVSTSVLKPKTDSKFHGKTFGKAGSQILQEDLGKL